MSVNIDLSACKGEISPINTQCLQNTKQSPDAVHTVRQEKKRGRTLESRGGETAGIRQGKKDKMK